MTTEEVMDVIIQELAESKRECDEIRSIVKNQQAILDEGISDFSSIVKQRDEAMKNFQECFKLLCDAEDSLDGEILDKVGKYIDEKSS